MGPWRSSGPNLPGEEVKPETLGVCDLNTTEKVSTKSRNILLGILFSIHSLFFLFLPIIHKDGKRCQMFWRLKTHLTESEVHRKARHPSLGGWRTQSGLTSGSRTEGKMAEGERNEPLEGFQVLRNFRMKVEVFLVRMCREDSPSLGRGVHFFLLLFLPSKMVISKDHLRDGMRACEQKGL